MKHHPLDNKGSTIIGSRIKLRDRRLADALDDYTWRTDIELAQLDATTPLAITFPQYLSGYAKELRSFLSSRREFALETLDGKYIGNCVYYDINETWGEVQLGIMIGDRNYWGKGYGTDAVATLVSHIFRVTSLKRIYLKTLDTNSRAQHCFKKCGFHKCGHLAKDGYRFVLMELHHRQWEEQQAEI